MIKKLGLLIILLLLSLAIALPGGAATEATNGKADQKTKNPKTNQKSGELIFSTIVNTTNLDPQKGSPNDIAMIRNIYSALLDTVTGTHEIKPGLAEKYTVSPDRLSYTFHLRKGVKFHKGFGELTSRDVLFSYQRLMNPNTASMFAKDFNMVKSVTAPNKYTVIYKLKTPFTPFPYLVSAAEMGAFILSEKAVKKFGEQYGKSPIGTGPFILKEWIPQNSVTLLANPDYYDGAPKIKKLTYREISDGTTAFMAFRKGEVQAFYTDQQENIKQAKTMKNAKILSKAANSQYSLWMNTKQKPFDDLRVRQAMNYAIDKMAIVKALFGDVHLPAKGYVPSVLKGYTTVGVKQYEYNPAKAKKLLTEAGYPNGFTVEAKVLNSPGYQRIFTMLQAQLGQVGIKLDYQPAATPEWLSFQYSGKALFGGWPFTRVPEIHFVMYSYYHSNNKPPASNGSFYGGIDDLLNKAAAEKNWAARAKYYQQAQRKLSEDVPFITIYQGRINVIADKRIKDIIIGGDYPQDIRFDKASWE